MSDPVLDRLQSIDDLACEYGCEHLSEDDQFKEVAGDLVKARAKVMRLTSRGIEDMRFRITELEQAIRKAAKDFQDMRWGYDGDCGSGSIIDDLEEVLNKETNK